MSCQKLAAKVDYDTVLSPVRDFKLTKVSDDSTQASFMLNRGSYATMVLRELMKPKIQLSRASSGIVKLISKLLVLWLLGCCFLWRTKHRQDIV